MLALTDLDGVGLLACGIFRTLLNSAAQGWLVLLFCLHAVLVVSWVYWVARMYMPPIVRPLLSTTVMLAAMPLLRCRPDKHRAFALEGRGSWHSLSASLAQQVFGPVSAGSLNAVRRQLGRAACCAGAGMACMHAYLLPLPVQMLVLPLMPVWHAVTVL